MVPEYRSAPSPGARSTACFCDVISGIWSGERRESDTCLILFSPRNDLPAPDFEIRPLVLAKGNQLWARRRQKDLAPLLSQKPKERLRSCAIEFARDVVEEKDRPRSARRSDNVDLGCFEGEDQRPVLPLRGYASGGATVENQREIVSMWADAGSASPHIPRPRHNECPPIRILDPRRPRGIRDRERQVRRCDLGKRIQGGWGKARRSLFSHGHDREAVPNDELFPLVQIRCREAASVERALPLARRALVPIEIVERACTQMDRDAIEEATPFGAATRRER
jgi:hypothetical protein